MERIKEAAIPEQSESIETVELSEGQVSRFRELLNNPSKRMLFRGELFHLQGVSVDDESAPATFTFNPSTPAGPQDTFFMGGAFYPPNTIQMSSGTGAKLKAFIAEATITQVVINQSLNELPQGELIQLDKALRINGEEKAQEGEFLLVAVRESLPPELQQMMEGADALLADSAMTIHKTRNLAIMLLMGEDFPDSPGVESQLSLEGELEQRVHTNINPESINGHTIEAEEATIQELPTETPMVVATDYSITSTGNGNILSPLPFSPARNPMLEAYLLRKGTAITLKNEGNDTYILRWDKEALKISSEATIKVAIAYDNTNVQ